MAHLLEDPLGDGGRLVFVRHVLEQGHELVPAEAGEGVGAPQAGAEPLGHLDEELVADLVAQTVVDHLEAVEIDEQQRVCRAGAGGPGLGVAQPVEEQRPVR